MAYEKSIMEYSKIDKNIEIYCALMNEVKKRTLAITQMLKGQTTTSFRATNIEFMCLQLRKILELISMGSLVLNKEEFEAIGKKYEDFWNAKLIFQDIERLNPNFYPIAIKEVPSHKEGVVNDLQNKTEGVLTRNDFVKVYDKCGKMMHSYNPFGSHYDYDYYAGKIMEWENLIIGLLNSHLIHIKGVDGFCLINMKEHGQEGVHGYYFGKYDVSELSN